MNFFFSFRRLCVIGKAMLVGAGFVLKANLFGPFEVFPVKFPVFLGNFADDPGRIAGAEYIVGHIFRNDGAGTGYDVVSDGDAGIYDDIAAQPDIIPDGDGDAPLVP